MDEVFAKPNPPGQLPLLPRFGNMPLVELTRQETRIRLPLHQAGYASTMIDHIHDVSSALLCTSANLGSRSPESGTRC